MLKILAICSKRNFIFGWVILKIIFLNQDSSSLLIVIDDLGGAGNILTIELPNLFIPSGWSTKGFATHVCASFEVRALGRVY